MLRRGRPALEIAGTSRRPPTRDSIPFGQSSLSQTSCGPAGCGMSCGVSMLTPQLKLATRNASTDEAASFDAPTSVATGATASADADASCVTSGIAISSTVSGSIAVAGGSAVPSFFFDLKNALNALLILTVQLVSIGDSRRKKKSFLRLVSPSLRSPR